MGEEATWKITTSMAIDLVLNFSGVDRLCQFFQNTADHPEPLKPKNQTTVLAGFGSQSRLYEDMLISSFS
jgi:hypothetical protein